jgi:hypothetical protein
VKARIIEKPAPIYDASDTLMAAPITELPVGTEVELGSVKMVGGRQWVTIAVADGRRGLVAGDVKVFMIKWAALHQSEVTVYNAPNAASGVKTTYGKGAKFYLTGTTTVDGKAWTSIRDAQGSEGFVDGQTLIKVIPVANRAVAKKNMLVGGLWCVGGLAVTGFTYASASSGGGTYFIMWGPAIFGAIQFFRGVYQYFGSAV